MTESRLSRFRTPTSVLIIANIVAIIFAVVQKWDVAAVLCLYLTESFIIMGFNCVRVLSLRQFTAAQKWGAIILTIFLNAFIFPMVIGCLVGALILAKPHYDSASFAGFNLCIMIFIANHAFSCRDNIRSDRLTTPNIFKILAIPFVRILMIFLTASLGAALFISIGGAGAIFILVFFLIIKTIVDVKMHNWSNNIGKDKEQTGSMNMVEHRPEQQAMLTEGDKLSNCPKCQVPVSSSWVACPQCGTPLNQPFGDIVQPVVKRPSQMQYFAGIAIIAITSVIAVGLLMSNMFRDVTPDMRFVVPGTHQLQFNESGEYAIYHEYLSSMDGKLYSTTSISGMDIAIYDDDSHPIALTPPSINFSYEINGRSGKSVLEFQIDEPGTYSLVADYDEGESGPDVVLAIGKPFSFGSFFGSFAASFIIGTLGFLIGLVIIIRTIVKRRDIGRRSGVTPVDKFWC